MEYEPAAKVSGLGLELKCPHCKTENADIKTAIDEHLVGVNGAYEVVYCNDCKTFLGCSLARTQLAP